MTLKWNHQSLIALTYSNHPKGKPDRYTDPKGNGLALKVSKRSKTWLWQARVNGCPRQITVGKFPALGLDAARKSAGNIQADHDQGLDVYVLHGAGIAAPNPAIVPSGKTVLTCDEAWRLWIAALTLGTNLHGKPSNKQRTIIEKESVWRLRFRDRIGDMPIVDITEDDLWDAVQAIRDDGHLGAANSAIRYVRAFFKWARYERRRTGLEVDPAQYLKPSKLDARDRALNEDEIRWLWQVIGREEPIWRSIYRLALLTGQRRQEIVGLERGEVSITKQHLEIGAERMKHGRPHLVPVGPLAWQIVTERLAATNSNFLFQSFADDEEERAVSGFSRAQKRIREAVEALAAKEGRTVPPWRFHDLRRTYSTLSNRMRGRPGRSHVHKDHIERVMSHIIAGVEGTYDRNDYYHEKRVALALWEQELLSVVQAQQRQMAKKDIESRNAA